MDIKTMTGERGAVVLGLLLALASGPARAAEVEPAIHGFMQSVCSADAGASTLRRVTRDGATIGLSCAIQPSQTDRHIEDVGPIAALGHGWHMIAVPPRWDAMVGVYVHFVGSAGKPYAPGGDGDSASREVIADALAAGFGIIVLAYSNDIPVTDLCAAYARANGNDGNCGGKVREERIYGAGWFQPDPSPLVKVDLHNGIVNRLGKLWHLLTQGKKADDEAILPFAESANIYIGGHSQGAGMAMYIAMRHPTLGACMLAGPFDGPGSRGGFTDWMVEIPPERFATPLARLRGLIHEQDAGALVVPAYWRSIGMVQGQHYDSVAAPYAEDAHASVAKSPELGWARVSACFSPGGSDSRYVVTPVANLDMNAHCSHPLTRASNRAEYLAASPDALQALRRGFFVKPGTGATVAVRNACDHWNALDPAEKKAAKLCVFDDRRYVAELGLDVPARVASGRVHFEQEGYRAHDGYCLPAGIGVRSALGY